MPTSEKFSPNKGFALPLILVTVFLILITSIGLIVVLKSKTVDTHSAPSSTPVASSTQPKPEEQKKTIIKSGTSLTINLDVCMPGEDGFPWGLGSIHVSVKGLQEGLCVFEYTSEVEGGYSEYECKLSSSRKTVSISQVSKPDTGDYGTRVGIEQTFDPKKDCKLVKSGNIFFDQLNSTTK